MKPLSYLLAWLVVLGTGCFRYDVPVSDENPIFVDTNSSADDSDATEDTETGTDTDSDADSDTDSESDTPTDTVIVIDTDTRPCDAECDDKAYTACTCGVDDPCEWKDNYFCEATRCEQAGFATTFTDLVDCCGNECTTRTYSSCTCKQNDPCMWKGNGTCDIPGCGPDPQTTKTYIMWDDQEDCPDTDVCGGACDVGYYTTCTCHPDDPCEWIGDTWCDLNLCEAIGADYFDDSADCTDTSLCRGACDAEAADACTCHPDDPCNAKGDGRCDKPFCVQVGLPFFDDDADCT